MSTRFSRPAGAYDSTSVTTNKDKYKNDKIGGSAIASDKVDGDCNYIIDAVNALDDDISTLVAGAVTDNSITNAKIRDSVATSVIGRSANSTGAIDDLAVSGGKIANEAINKAKISTTLINAHTAITSLEDDDQFFLADNSDSDTNKKITYANIKTQLESDYAASTTVAGFVELATSGEAETGTATDKVMTPNTTGRHAGVAKAWAHCDVSGGSISLLASRNMTSVAYTSGGDYTATIDTDFSSANYALTFGAEGNGTGANSVVSYSSKAVGGFSWHRGTSTNSSSDFGDVDFIAMGDQ